jgi:hypothetical protein
MDFISDAMPFMVLRTLRGDRQRMNLFPELRARTVSKPTDASLQIVAPNLLVVTELYSFDVPIYNDSSGVPGGYTAQPDEGVAYRRRLEPITEDEYERLYRSGMAEDVWPRLWAAVGTQVRMFPAPSTLFAPWLLVKGLSIPARVTDPTVTLPLLDQWLPALTDASAYMAFKELGWEDDKKAAMSALDESIANTIDAMALQNARPVRRVRIKGAPGGG